MKEVTSVVGVGVLLAAVYLRFTTGEWQDNTLIVGILGIVLLGQSYLIRQVELIRKENSSNKSS